MELVAGKVVVITGGASGIGKAMAERFAAEGSRLVLGDIEAEALYQTAAALRAEGAEVEAVTCDVTELASVERLRDAALDRFGSVHILCNNAGVAAGGPLWQIPVETWRWVLGVNLFGVIHGIHTFVPLLVEQDEGHVVNTASVAGLLSAPGLGPYNASKHAVVTISETLVQDLAAAGSSVGVSVLCPAFVRTRIHEADRNAPEEVTQVPLEGAREANWQVFSALVGAGIEPGIVASAVVDAIRDGSFYVLTHPESIDWVRARYETLLEGGNPGAPLRV